ncbi:TorF family putative porin [Uliginosibacterium sp. 31-16]|uniref:TorF family putative porin n=1 Tax=Uliginosibacterium sp. 31-16 TaxID=3068315 RepID=UPI00273E9DE3|nr:TorF family putative porin [Uliginosibacterium sp. 31-16]MDP5239190.1 TorF family putative porin [Uliginosibacterium sp. 31-16]
MRLSIIAASLLSALSALPALAADEAPASPHTFTGNMTVASEYIYRGIAQTNRKPAIQGGVDYSHSSGVYVGAWASNISWLSDAQVAGVSAPVEIDTYGGYKHAFGDVTLDVGVLKYNYPGTYPAGFVNPDTLEGYLGVSYKFASFKYSRSFSNLFGAQSVQEDGSTKKTDGSQYFDLSANPELGAGFTLNLHAGRQQVANFPNASYNDYKAGVTYDLKGWAVGVAYVTTTAKASTGDFYRSALNRDLGADRIVVSLGKTF